MPIVTSKGDPLRHLAPGLTIALLASAKLPTQCLCSPLDPQNRSHGQRKKWNDKRELPAFKTHDPHSRQSRIPSPSKYHYLCMLCIARRFCWPFRKRDLVRKPHHPDLLHAETSKTRRRRNSTLTEVRYAERHESADVSRDLPILEDSTLSPFSYLRL